jgi:hypothetical protein
MNVLSLRMLNGKRNLCLLFLIVILLLARGSQLSAQLNENCLVAVLNRTARVDATGGWYLPNVPANLGPVRARATCVENGITTFAQSDVFTVPANNTVSIEINPLGQIDPIPSAILLSALNTLLTNIGTSQQLIATAVFPDNTTTDVTPQNSGTGYTISNPSVATVSVDGLVTAVSSGTVIISASNEGAIGLIQIRVVLSGDSDGDGIPDDLELANGLDPNNAVDGEEDPDEDGLTNKQELVDYGTNFQLADTDGDGLSDGEEVTIGADGYITNPLITDTDGDGISDGLEIATGTDPTDPNSYNLATALASLDVTPEYSVLILNSIIGEASRQLTVKGRLIDGSTIDLTSTTRGTNYDSSNLDVCNFGGTDGLVFAGSVTSTCTITVSNSGFSDIATISVQAFQPIAISSIAIPGTAEDVDVNGDHAYVAAGTAGLQVVDISDRHLPTIIGSADTPGSALAVQVSEDFAYVADAGSGIRIFDISNPQPTFVGTLDTTGSARDIAILNNLLYVADGLSGLEIIDVLNPSAPSLVGSLNTPGNSQGIDISSNGNIAVVADGTTGVYVIDVTNPASPSILGNVDTGTASDVVISGNYAYVADSQNSLTIVDISVPTNPIIVGSTPSSNGGLLNDLAVVGQFALGADFFFNSTGIPISDVSNPASPTVRNYLQFDFFSNEDGTGIDADGSYVYLTASKTGSQRLYIGQYLQIQDQAGIPPSVSITTPLSGSSVDEGSIFVITVHNSDDMAVAGIQLFANGEIVDQRSWPIQETEFFSYQVVGNIDLLSLQIRAVDFGDNVGFSNVVEVQVVADQQPPSVEIISPTEGTTVVEGAQITAIAEAGDNIGVASVKFVINGNIVFEDTVAPYEYSFNAPLNESSIVLTAVASDQRGNVTTSAPINVFITCNTSVTGRILTAQQQPVANADVQIFGQPQNQAVTDTLGGFSIVGELGCSPFISVIASGFVSNQSQVGQSSKIAIVAGGTTNVGDVIVNPLGTALYPGPEFAVGNAPHYAALGDLNGDGKLDIVTSNFASEDVSILLSSGQGLFVPQRRVGVGVVPVGIVVDDFNHDSLQDIVTANLGTADISVLLGNGDGTFDSESRYSAGGEVWGIATGDFNEDGELDIAASNIFSNAVSVLFGNGDGSFQSPQPYGAGDNPYFLAVADVNNDTHADIVAANRGCRFGPDPCISSNDISILLGNGDGTFQAEQRFIVGDGPFSVALADLNGDNLIDIVTANEISNDISVLFGLGGGTFNPQQVYPVGEGPDSLAIADFNVDANLDIIVVNSNTNDVSVLVNDGNGGFLSEERHPVGFDPGGVAVGQLNDDSGPDAVVTNFDTDSIVILFNGAPILNSQKQIATGLQPDSVTVSDINEDSIPDLVFAHFGMGEIAIYSGTGDGNFNETTTLNAGAANTIPTVISRDLNSDTHVDLAWADLANGEIVVRLGAGDGSFGSELRTSVGSAPYDVMAADLDNDSILDLITANKDSNNISILIGNGDGTFQGPTLYDTGNSPATIAVGLVNNDSSPDIMVSNLDSNDLSIFFNNGDGTFQVEQRIAVGTTPVEIVVTDFNGDGKLDIATTNFGSMDLSILLGNGDGTFGAATNFAMDATPGSLRVADVNDDSFADLIIGAENDSFLMLMIGNGDGTFIPSQRHETGNTPSSTSIFDLNGDGKLDIVTTNFSSDNLSILLHR